MVVTYYINLFLTAADGYNVLLMSLLLLIPENVFGCFQYFSSKNNIFMSIDNIFWTDI